MMETVRTNTKMIEYSTVYGKFYRGNEPVDGHATFIPQETDIYIDGNLYSMKPFNFPVVGGTLMSNGAEGVSLPASFSGIRWKVIVLPLNYSIMVESFPGDIFSLGD